MAKQNEQSVVINETITPEAALGSIHQDDQQVACMKLDSTSKKIRFLLSKTNGDRGKVVKLLKEYGVTTKDGGPISYQFVNNVSNQKTK